MYNKNNEKVNSRKGQLFYARVKPNNNKIMRRQVILLLYTDNNGSFKEYIMTIRSFNTVNYHFKIFHLLFLYMKI